MATIEKRGRKSTLTEDRKLQIRELVLQGKEYKEIREELSIPESTWKKWKLVNHNQFDSFITQCKADFRLKLAEKVSDQILLHEGESPKVLAIKQKEAEFIRETLGKALYSKRPEMIALGNDAQIQINYITPSQIEAPKQVDYIQEGYVEPSG